MATTTLSQKHRIEIPKEIRDATGWKPGDRLAFIPKGHGLMLVRVPTLPELYGIAEGADASNCRERLKQ
jgi:AbrB family looped-hinge helix DNA binding protein